MQQWLYLITRTTLADHWRTHYRLPSSSLDELIDAGWEGPVGEELAATSSSTAERVQRILQALPERYREVLKCRFLLKPSLKATAQQMGVTIPTANIITFLPLNSTAALL